MLDNLFKGLFDTALTDVIGVTDFLLCLGFSLLLACLSAFDELAYSSFYPLILPEGMEEKGYTVVCVVIMMVNGNVGTGVAVAGAFSLVRFRSVPGTAKEIGVLFLAMGVGLIAGMGYLAFAALFTVIMCAVFMLYNRLDFGAKKNAQAYKTLTITIPEELDYAGVFDEIFAQYTVSYELMTVKTTNMGSLFRLTYHIVLRDPAGEKEMIDKLRCRNGNLEIIVSRQETASAEL